MSARAVSHLDDNYIASCSQYPGDSCSDTGSANFPVVGCRCGSSQNIPNVELRIPVSSTGEQYELPRGSREISHREIETQRESSFRGSSALEASTSGFGEIKLIIAIVAATMLKH